MCCNLPCDESVSPFLVWVRIDVGEDEAKQNEPWQDVADDNGAVCVDYPSARLPYPKKTSSLFCMLAFISFTRCPSSAQASTKEWITSSTEQYCSNGNGPKAVRKFQS